MERQKIEKTPKGMVLYVAATDNCCGSMRWYLQPSQVEEVVQLLQDSTSVSHSHKKVCRVSQHSLKCTVITRRRSITRRELGRAIEGHKPSSRTSKNWISE